MKNFAHRGLFASTEEENTLPALRRALAGGFDIEADIRLWGGEFLIKHDEPLTGEILPKLSDIVALLHEYPEACLALHYKYDDWRQAGADRVVPELAGILDRVFLFDMSLDFCEQLKRKNKQVQVGVSVGDKEYHDAFASLDDALDSSIDFIWADENRSLYSAELVDRCHAAGKKIFCISPDLAGGVGHPRSRGGYTETWRDLVRWGVDGICTDRSVELKDLIAHEVMITKQ